MRNDGGIKGFFIYHGEKVAAFLVLCFAGMLFAWGYSVESIDDNKSPAVLQNLESESSPSLF